MTARRPVLATTALLSLAAVLPVPAAEPPAGPAPLAIPEAVAVALARSPDLLDARDLLARAEANLAGVRALFRPQVTPFFGRSPHDGDLGPSTSLGATFSQQFAFGPRVLASAQASSVSGEDGYDSAFSASVQQPLLRGADPAVTREPLRAARRFVETQSRSLSTRRRQTVLATWSAYLSAVASEELLLVARESADRSGKLLEASRARFAAGSVSRLDVLRAEQLLASARAYAADAEAARDDAHDALGRLLGMGPGSRFLLDAPERLPVETPEVEAAVTASRTHREELVEERERLRDTEAQLRIAKSLVLPSLDLDVGWSATGSGSGAFDALTSPGRSAFSLGFRASADVNRGQTLSQKVQAEIAVGTARRAAQLLEADVERQVRAAARRLSAARQRLAIEETNLEVARTQLEVAALRFEKGLSDNFHVVDAENLYNSARVALLSSRNAVLLAGLDLLSAAGLLVPEDFAAPR